MLAILHNIRSLHNVGSIFRTADAAGIEKLYLCGITPAPVDRFGQVRTQIAKVALGAERYVAWDKRHETRILLDELERDGYRIVAVEQDKHAVPYYEYKATCFRPRFGKQASDMRQEKIALLVGAEIKGLPQPLLKKCDTILEIPMNGKKESLNVAVAFGIVAFHLRYSSHHG